MSTLKYVGTPARWDAQPQRGQDLVDQDYVNLLLATNLTSPAVTAEIVADLVGYATTANATAAMAGLATPTYTLAQVANYVPVSAIDAASGPVGLNAVGQIPQGLINAGSTQTWPSPFWSPAAYQASPVTASTTPAQLYTAAQPYPGYTYVPVCFGIVDTSVALDDGTIPEVLVRVGSTTGQIIAFGYGTAENYTTPTPGQVASQCFLNTAFTATASYTTIAGLLALNSASFTSTMVGNFLQVPQSMTATMAASFDFSGAAPGSKSTVSTSIQIIDSSANVIATGATVTGDSGTVTASVTKVVTAGQLFGVQIAEASSTFASVNDGTFTISPATVQNTGPANIIPVPFEDITPLTAATTLYVMLQSSNSSTAVTASTFDPSLWVMPVPWI